MQHLSLILLGSTKLWQCPKSLLKMKLLCTLSVYIAMESSKLLEIRNFKVQQKKSKRLQSFFPLPPVLLDFEIANFQFPEVLLLACLSVSPSRT